MADQVPEVKIRFIKKKGGHGAAHGGAWKVAYADLVTAMMAFFLLMWLLGTANQNTKAGIAGMFQDANFFDTAKGKAILENYGKGILPGGRGMAPIDGAEESGAGDAADAKALAEEEEKMKSTAAAIEDAFNKDQLLQAFKDQISMDFTEEGLRIQIQDKATQVLFDSGSARIKPATLAILKEIAKELGKLPNHIVVGGHTDAAPYAGLAYTNWELSADRANAARRAMEASGLRPEQVKKVTGYAHTKPLDNVDPRAPQQRRISIVVMSSATEAAETARQKVKPAKAAKEGPPKG